jgi:hypothetical protein
MTVIMLAHTRNRVRTGAAAHCVPCSQRQSLRMQNTTRTAGIEISGAGVPEWQKTNKAVLATEKELRNWVDAFGKEAQKRSDSGTFGGLCMKGGPLQECLLPNEREAVKWIAVVWNPFAAEWNELVKKATTGVPWGEDSELRSYQKKLVELRKRFEELAVYRFVSIEPWSEDRGFLQAIKESTGVDVAGGLGNVGLIVAGVGGAIVLASLLKK